MRNSIKTPLNQAQLMVLTLVKEQYNENDLSELRQLLLDFNHRKMQKQLDQTVAEKGYKAKDFEQMLKGHARKTR
jgi:hypothetical protein